MEILPTRQQDEWNPTEITENANISVQKKIDARLKNLTKTWPNTFIPHATKQIVTSVLLSAVACTLTFIVFEDLIGNNCRNSGADASWIHNCSAPYRDCQDIAFGLGLVYVGYKTVKSLLFAPSREQLIAKGIYEKFKGKVKPANKKITDSLTEKFKTTSETLTSYRKHLNKDEARTAINAKLYLLHTESEALIKPKSD